VAIPPPPPKKKKKNGLSSMKMCLIVGNMHQRFFRAGGDLTWEIITSVTINRQSWGEGGRSKGSGVMCLFYSMLQLPIILNCKLRAWISIWSMKSTSAICWLLGDMHT
jgi:hypothetical protein